MSRVHLDLGGISQLAKGFADLSGKIQDRVTSRAVVTLARRVGPQVNRLIAEDLNLSTTKVKSRITVTKGADFVEVTGSGKQIALSEFQAKWSGRKSAGAVAQIFRDSPAKVYVGAFITGGRVVSRKRLSSGKRVGRLPLRQPLGPDIGSILISSSGSHQIAGPLLGFVRDTLSAEIARLVSVEIANF